MKNKRISKKIKAVIGLAAVVGLAASGFLFYESALASTTPVKTTALVKHDLTSSVRASGTIKSGEKQNIYSTLNYPVKEILVKEGDYVNAGDVVAVLDMDAGSFDSATIEISNAQVTADKEKNNVSLCRSEVESTRSTYENNKVLYDCGFLSRQEIDDLYKAYTDAQLRLKIAEQTYESAQNNLEASTIKMEHDLDRIELYSPIDGIVTRVRAEVGEPPAGILFVVEDMNHLYADIDIKEFDVSSVSVGQPAIVRIEGSQSTEISGAVSYVAVAAKETANASSTNVKYETYVTFSGENTGIRLGMNARAEIELESKKDVFSVYYDSIVRDEEGQTWIYIAQNGVVRAVPVACGLETETRIEILGDELQEGMQVITAPADFMPGDKISTEGEV